jgi:hypothetical protein
MKATSIIRCLAYAVAVTAALDPPLRSNRLVPIAVSLREPNGALALNVPMANQAGAVRAALESAMPGDVAINTTAEPQAVVVAGGRLEAAALPVAGPVSFVLPSNLQGPTVRILSVTSPRPVLPGWPAVITADIEGRDMTVGSTVAVVLESNGVEVDRLEHKWNHGDDRFTARLTFAPPSAGNFGLGVRVGERESMPVRVLAEQRRLKILSFDPRPSWASGFVRRVLEDDPDFDIVARVRPSRGLEVRTGSPPLVLSADTLNPFDLVMVGAPEGLTATEVDALDAFARKRGGTVVLLADRKPSGAYVRLVGVEAFDEALLERPIKLTADDATSLRASEFAYPRVMPAGGEALIAFPHAGSSRTPLVSVPAGAGRIVFSGLLDAWRYRDDNDDTFATFWRSQLGREAARAPRRLEVTLTPAAATPGTPVRMRAAVRATEHLSTAAGVSIPAIDARVLDERGHPLFVRLWPTAETGLFEGKFVAPSAGRYDVQVRTDTGVSADVPFVVSDGGRLADADVVSESASLVANSTGGVAVTVDNLGRLVEHLRSLNQDVKTIVHHPMRSVWWAVVFTGLLSAEWLVRRRQGLR